MHNFLREIHRLFAPNVIGETHAALFVLGDDLVLLETALVRVGFECEVAFQMHV